MLTRHKTRQAQEAAGRQAVQCVLRNPDLVALILERLPVPQLGFGFRRQKVYNRDRWAASQVNAVFRSAALRLPWDALWSLHRYSESILGALAVLRPRQVQAWNVSLASEETARGRKANKGAAALLSNTRDTESLYISIKRERDLFQWLHHTLSALPDAQGSSDLGTPMLACLASLSRLTYLSVNCVHSFETGADASWVTVMKQLKCIELLGFNCPPLAGLPALESLRIMCRSSEGRLEQWVTPRMTALSLHSCALHWGLPGGGYSAQEPAASGSDARGWLHRLRRLELEWCRLSTYNSAGLRQLVPALTHLGLAWHADEGKHMTQLVSEGLPVGLKSLALVGLQPVWPAVFELHDLVSLEVREGEESACDDVAVGLMRLPHLMQVSLSWCSRRSSRIRVEGPLKALSALLLTRQGRLALEL